MTSSPVLEALYLLLNPGMYFRHLDCDVFSDAAGMRLSLVEVVEELDFVLAGVGAIIFL